MSGKRASMDGFGVLAMFGLCVIWALGQVAIKVADMEVEPVFQAGLRSLLAGCLVFAWCRWRRIRLFERDHTLAPGLALGLMFSAEFALVFLAYDDTTVSRAVVVFHTMPIFCRRWGAFAAAG